MLSCSISLFPTVSGLETLVRFQSKFPKLPVVILTGLNDEETAVQAAHAGAQDYFVKGTIAGPALGRALKVRDRTEKGARDHSTTGGSAAGYGQLHRDYRQQRHDPVEQSAFSQLTGYASEEVLGNNPGY